MAADRDEVRCMVCNPGEAEQGEYCERHKEELHRLDHQYEVLFRLQRVSRGKGHESYHVFLQGDCEPSGRVLVNETDPDNLAITVLVSRDLNLDARITGYEALKIERTYGDQLRDRIRQDVIHSWYGNARACVEVFRISSDAPLHWDIDPRGEGKEEEEASDFHAGQATKHSVH
ncbi:MAG TPA: hypothetical protein VE398_14135 [Acidobacteriota bacterium]|nr:hypothetical protein [Acidobacteriota bacterium]